MTQEDRWEYMYDLLVLYKEKYGNVEVSSRYVTPNGKNLGTWVNNQRNLYKIGKLSMDREEKLKLLGFRFGCINRQEKWNYMYNLLVQYKEKYGDTEVSQGYVASDGENLGTWVKNQRVVYKKNELSTDKVEKLRLLGFRFDDINKDEKWNYMYNLLVLYKEKYGSTEVYRSYVAPNGENLGTWVNYQRNAYRNNKLSIDKVEKLRLLGFRLDNVDSIKSNSVYGDLKWDYMYNLLVKYKMEYGNVEVSCKYVTTNGENLGTWVNNQRTMYKNNKLCVDRVEKLRLLGFRFGNDIQRSFVNNSELSCSEIIRKICLAYNINYDKYKDIFNRLSYNDFFSRLYYALNNHMDIVNENGDLNTIFYMDNDTIYRYIGCTSEELNEEYNKNKGNVPIRIRRR